MELLAVDPMDAIIKNIKDHLDRITAALDRYVRTGYGDKGEDLLFLFEATKLRSDFSDVWLSSRDAVGVMGRKPEFTTKVDELMAPVDRRIRAHAEVELTRVVRSFEGSLPDVRFMKALEAARSGK